MKNILTSLLLMVTFAVSAQQTYWTHYGFVVEPQNEATFFKVIDDYFKEYKWEGVSISLYKNHFYDTDNEFTHLLVLSGSLDAMGVIYVDGSNDSWAMLMSQIAQHIKEGAGARMGTIKASYGDTAGDYPIQRYFLLDVENATAFETAYSKYQEGHPPVARVVMMGNFTSGISPEGENRWVLAGYKDFKAAIGGSDATLTPAEIKARDASWKVFQENNGGVRMVRSGLRVRLGQW
jgi:hypothetical protein